MKQQILFVDDEPNLLQGLQRMLRPMRQQWEMRFAETGPEALALLDRTPCDVVVSDMRMPGMDGAQLLTEVRRRHPATVRFILSGHSDRDMILRAVGPTHQFLAKPCDADMLKSAVSRACTLRTLLPDTTLTELVTGIETLPSAPALYQQVLEAAQAPESSLDTIGQTIASDLSMTAKVLQLVHSAFFGLQRHISNPTQAVDLLGLDTMQTLVLTAQIFSYADAATMGRLSLEGLWEHSMAIGICAKCIAQAEGCDQQLLDDTFAAGWLHDVGALVLATHLPELCPRVQALALTDDKPTWEAERAILGTTHAEIGAYLMGLWGLSDPIVEALTYHHHPTACPTQTFRPLTAVHVADALVDELDACTAGCHASRLDDAYLEALQLRARLPIWQERCQQALQDLAQTEPLNREPRAISHV